MAERPEKLPYNSGYFLFCHRMRKDLDETMQKDVTQASKEMGKRWGDLTHETKEEYNAEYKAIAEEHAKKMEAYYQVHPDEKASDLEQARQHKAQMLMKKLVPGLACFSVVHAKEVPFSKENAEKVSKFLKSQFSLLSTEAKKVFEDAESLMKKSAKQQLQDDYFAVFANE